MQKCQITDLMQYLNTQPAADTTSPCFQNSSQMFIQVGCLIPEAAIEGRVENGLVLGCAAVFIALLVVNFLDYIKKVQENNYVEWDVKTITSGDFTIEFDITKALYEDYVEKEHQGWVNARAEEGQTPPTVVAGFQGWIQHEMEKRLEQLPNLGFDGDDEESSVKVAVTTLAFDNAAIINLLRDRGAAIKAENWDL